MIICTHSREGKPRLIAGKYGTACFHFYTVFFVCIVFSPKYSKNLDPSSKMDTDFWNCFRRGINKHKNSVECYVAPALCRHIRNSMKASV